MHCKESVVEQFWPRQLRGVLNQHSGIRRSEGLKLPAKCQGFKERWIFFFFFWQQKKNVGLFYAVSVKRTLFLKPRKLILANGFVRQPVG